MKKKHYSPKGVTMIKPSNTSAQWQCLSLGMRNMKRSVSVWIAEANLRTWCDQFVLQSLAQQEETSRFDIRT